MATKEGALFRDPDSHGGPVDVSNRLRTRSPWRIISEVLRYGLVSAAALALDTALLKALVVFAGWHYLPASVVSFVCGAIVAYALSVKYVFRVQTSQNKAWEFACFVLLGTVGLLVNSLILSLTVGVIGLGLIAAKLTAAVFTFGTNFVLRRQLLFSKSEDC